jgi:hypothetical protein
LSKDDAQPVLGPTNVKNVIKEEEEECNLCGQEVHSMSECWVFIKISRLTNDEYLHNIALEGWNMVI